MKVNDVVRLSKMLDVYGGLLTTKQREILNDYLNYDEGLSEIADAGSTTRQAVLDIVRRASANLEEYESKLGLVNKLQFVLDKIPAICDKYVEKDKRDAFIKDVSSLFETLGG